MTLLPAQVERLARIVAQLQLPGAVGISQKGSVITIDTGQVEFTIDAEGRFILPANTQEP